MKLAERTFEHSNLNKRSIVEAILKSFFKIILSHDCNDSTFLILVGTFEACNEECASKAEDHIRRFVLSNRSSPQFIHHPSIKFSGRHVEGFRLISRCFADWLALSELTFEWGDSYDAKVRQCLTQRKPSLAYDCILIGLGSTARHSRTNA